MAAKTGPVPPPARRRRLGRLQLVGICIAGVVVVLLVATVHPWWGKPTPPPTFTLVTLDVTFNGSASSAVHATSICAGHCPITLSAGTEQTLAFTVTPYTAIANCSPSTYYTVTKVTETTTGSAFQLNSVSADTGTKLPVTIPNPLGSSTCVTTATIYVSFGVADQGPTNQTPALKVTVTHS